MCPPEVNLHLLEQIKEEAKKKQTNATPQTGITTNQAQESQAKKQKKNSDALLTPIFDYHPDSTLGEMAKCSRICTGNSAFKNKLKAAEQREKDYKRLPDIFIYHIATPADLPSPEIYVDPPAKHVSAKNELKSAVVQESAKNIDETSTEQSNNKNETTNEQLSHIKPVDFSRNLFAPLFTTEEGAKILKKHGLNLEDFIDLKHKPTDDSDLNDQKTDDFYAKVKLPLNLKKLSRLVHILFEKHPGSPIDKVALIRDCYAYHSIHGDQQNALLRCLTQNDFSLTEANLRSMLIVPLFHELENNEHKVPYLKNLTEETKDSLYDHISSTNRHSVAIYLVKSTMDLHIYWNFILPHKSKPEALPFQLTTKVELRNYSAGSYDVTTGKYIPTTYYYFYDIEFEATKQQYRAKLIPLLTENYKDLQLPGHFEEHIATNTIATYLQNKFWLGEFQAPFDEHYNKNTRRKKTSSRLLLPNSSERKQASSNLLQTSAQTVTKAEFVQANKFYLAKTAFDPRDCPGLDEILVRPLFACLTPAIQLIMGGKDQVLDLHSLTYRSPVGKLILDTAFLLKQSSKYKETSNNLALFQQAEASKKTIAGSSVRAERPIRANDFIIKFVNAIAESDDFFAALRTDFEYYLRGEKNFKKLVRDPDKCGQCFLAHWAMSSLSAVLSIGSPFEVHASYHQEDKNLLEELREWHKNKVLELQEQMTNRTIANYSQLLSHKNATQANKIAEALYQVIFSTQANPAPRIAKVTLYTIEAILKPTAYNIARSKSTSAFAKVRKSISGINISSLKKSGSNSTLNDAKGQPLSPRRTLSQSSEQSDFASSSSRFSYPSRPRHKTSPSQSDQPHSGRIAPRSPRHSTAHNGSKNVSRPQSLGQLPESKNKQKKLSRPRCNTDRPQPTSPRLPR